MLSAFGTFEPDMSPDLSFTITAKGDPTAADTLYICLDPSFHSALQELISSRAAFITLEPSTALSNLSLESLESFAKELVSVLIPRLRQQSNQADPRFILLARQFNAITAIYTAARFPKDIAGVLAVAGAFWWKPEQQAKWEWLADWLSEQKACPSPIVLLCPEGETQDRPRGIPTTLLSNRHLKHVLFAKGCSVDLLETDLNESSGQFARLMRTALEGF